MAKVSISEKEICKREQKFYMDLAAKVEAVRLELNGLAFPIERLEKDERFPLEVDLLNIQFKALSENIWRIAGEKTHHMTK